MKLLFVLALFIAQSAQTEQSAQFTNQYSAVPISQRESAAIVDIINFQRFQDNKKIPMPVKANKVRYNFEVAKLIYDWSGKKEGILGSYGITNLNGCWRAESPNNVGSPMCHEIVYKHFFEPSWEYGMFGACGKGQFPISTELKRSNSNFDYRKCNDTVSTYNYGTCAESPNSRGPLSFVPSLLDSDLSEVSCLLINGPLPGTTRRKNKGRSFFCITRKDNSGDGVMVPKKGDRPYEAARS